MTFTYSTLTDSVDSRNLTTFNTALCSIFEVIILLTPRSLTAEIKIRLSDSVPHDVKNISAGKTLNSFAIDFLAFSIKVLDDLPKL